MGFQPSDNYEDDLLVILQSQRIIARCKWMITQLIMHKLPLLWSYWILAMINSHQLWSQTPLLRSLAPDSEVIESDAFSC